MNPANVKFCCSGECGVNGIGTASAGVEHWASLTFTAPTVATSPGGRGTRCYRCTAQGYFTHNFASAIASPATLVYRFFVYFAGSLPSADQTLPCDGSSAWGVCFKQSDSKIYTTPDFGGTLGSSGVSVVADTWYCIDVKVVLDTNRTIDAQVTPLGGSATACGQYVQVGGGAASSTGIRLGAQNSGTFDIYLRDLICSGTAADYPIGPGQGYALFPNADRTNSAANPTDGNKGHLFSATTDFGKGASGATATGAQNAESTSWQSLANPLSTSIGTNWIADLLGASTEHMVWELADLPADALTVNGVMLVCTTHSASTTTNAFGAGIGNASAQVSKITGDLSESTITIPVAVCATDASAAAWDVAKVNATTIYFGDSADVNPDPYLDGACLEVDAVLAVGRVPYVNPMPPLIAQ